MDRPLRKVKDHPAIWHPVSFGRTVCIDLPRGDVTTVILRCALEGGHPINRIDVGKGLLVLTRTSIWWPYPTGIAEIHWSSDGPSRTLLHGRWVAGRNDSRVGASVLHDAERLLADVCQAAPNAYHDESARRRVAGALAWLEQCGTVRPSAIPAPLVYATTLVSAAAFAAGVAVNMGEAAIAAAGGLAVGAGAWSLSALAQSEGRDALATFQAAVGSSTAPGKR